ncbi:MAG: sugar phosphate isomerase/epimerase [Chloroflexi bacterium]|nr:sugar phosphate isomerase/epimerase [Chloroflexota bacterium]
MTSRCLSGSWRLTGALCPARAPFAPLLFAGRLEEGLRTLGALQYDAIELSLRQADEVDARWLEALLAELGLGVSTISTGRMFYEQRLSISSLEENVRRACREQTKPLLRLASRFGAALTIGGVRGILPQDADARAHDAATGVLGEIASEARALQVTLLLEPINRYETNYVNTVEDALQLARDVGEPNVKLLLDTFHMNIEEVSVADAIRLAGPELAYVHLADSNRRAPGCGHTDFAAVSAALVETGFDGYIGMEILPWPDDAAAAKLGLEYTRKLASQFATPAG